MGEYADMAMEDEEWFARHQVLGDASLPARKRWHIKFEPRDLWVGLFWDRRYDGLHVYVCPLPCVVLHVVLK